MFSRSYFIAVHTVFKPIYSHSVRIYRLKEKTVPYIKNWRNSHYWLYETMFIIFRFTFFDVNCAFLAVKDFAVAAMPLAIV